MGFLVNVMEFALRKVIQKNYPGLYAEPGWEITNGQINFRDADDLWGETGQSEQQWIYRKQWLVFACITKIFQTFQEAPAEIGTETEDGEWEAVKKHPVISLLKSPNPDMTSSIFNAYRLVHKLTAGESFLWKWRNRLGEVTELWPVMPSWVTIVPLKDAATGKDTRLIARYDVQLPGISEPVHILPKDMIWDRFIDPSSFTGHVSPLEAGHRALRLGDEKDNYIIEMLENYEVPPIVYETEEDMTEKQKENFRAALRGIIGKKAKQRGRGILLDNKIKAQALTPPLKDLDWPGLSSMTESQVCAIYGVPPLIVHTRMSQENTPLSSPNLEAAEQMFYRGTMQSIWKTDAEILTRWLLEAEGWGNGLELRYDLSGIKALMDDLAELTTYCKEAVLGSIMQINEARKRLGLPPDPKREGAYLLPTNMTEFIPGVTDVDAGDGEEGNDDWNEEELEDEEVDDDDGGDDADDDDDDGV